MNSLKTRWVPLKFDLMAKKVFGNNENQDQIKFLLNQILNINPSYVEVLNNEIIDRPYKDKKFEVDLLVKTEEGLTIIVEINTDVNQKITDRNLFYMCRVMSRNLKRSEDFKNLNRHIQISFDFEGYQEEPIMDYKLIDKKTGVILSDKMEIIKVSVPYYNEKCYNEDANLQTRFIGLLNEENCERARKLIRGDKSMEDLYDKVMENSDDEIIGLYDIESHRREIEKSVIEDAMEKGLKKGIEEGIKEGIKEGIEKGVSKEKVNIAKNLLKKNFDIKIIEEITGLSKEEITKINI